MRHLLAATLILLTIAGCSKKEVATPIVSAGSYNLDNQTVACKPQVSTSTLTTTAGQTSDVLHVQLSTLPLQPGGEILYLLFQKPQGQASTAYQLYAMFLLNSRYPQGVFFDNTTATLSETSSGVFSGTFSGSVASPSGTVPPPYFTLSEGVFANARL
jgi:hypothetical protein